MGERQFAEDGLRLRSDLDQDFALVQGVAVAADHAQRGQAVDEAHDGVMLQLQLPGQGADGRQPVGGQPLDREEQLVLLGLEALLAGRPLAEHEEAAKKVAEVGQALIIWLAHPGMLRAHAPG